MIQSFRTHWIIKLEKLGGCRVTGTQSLQTLSTFKIVSMTSKHMIKTHATEAKLTFNLGEIQVKNKES